MKKDEEEKKKCNELYIKYLAAVQNEKMGVVKKEEAYKKIASLKIEYNNLIQKNNEKLAKQKSEFDQAIQALNKEIRDLEKENTSLKTECLQLKMSKEKSN